MQDKKSITETATRPEGQRVELVNKQQVREALFKLRHSYKEDSFHSIKSEVIADVLETLESVDSRWVRVEYLVP